MSQIVRETTTTTSENTTKRLQYQLSVVRSLIVALTESTSLERTERDRLLAAAVTEAQKLEAFIGYWQKP